MGLEDTASSGDRLAALEDLRDLLATTIVGTDSARDIAALSGRLTDVLAQIEDVKKATPKAKGTALDELKARRAARSPRAASR